jgi:hypothetical protein
MISKQARAQQPSSGEATPPTIAPSTPGTPPSTALGPTALPSQPPPPLGYAGLPLAPAPIPYYPPPTPEHERNSPGMMATGIVLASLGGLVGVGTLLVGLVDGATSGVDGDYANCGPSCAEAYESSDGNAAAYLIAGVGSGVAIAVGIPLIVVGARRVPTSDGSHAAERLLPSVAVSPTGGRLTWAL